MIGATIVGLPVLAAMACVLVVYVGAVMQAATGVGVGILSSPVLLLVDPDFIPAAVVVAVLPLTFSVAIADRSHIDRHGVTAALIGRVPGLVLGAIVVAAVSDTVLALLVSVTVLLGVAVSLTTKRFTPTTPALVIAGFGSGFTGTAVGVGGPPIALTYQHSDPVTMRATISFFFSVGSVLTAIALVVAGELGRRQLALAALLLPSIVLGLATARRYKSPSRRLGGAATGARAVGVQRHRAARSHGDLTLPTGCEVTALIWHDPGMRRLTAVLVGSLLVAASCASDDASTASTDTSPSTETPAESTPVTEPIVDDPPPTDPPATEPPTTEPPATEPPLADFVPLGDGEYAVGVQTIVITDETRDRPLTVEVWFPLAEGTTGEPQRYTFVTGDYYESPRAFSADASSISPDGPFPLVVYTHGSGGLRYIHSDYTETLASHGYIVVAADHTGNTAVELVLDTQDDQTTIAYNRPRDVQVVIDEMLNPESQETVGFVGSVDPDRIAVTGHSLGGYATYAVVSGMENAAGTLQPDGRIDALIPLAPALGDGNPETSLLTNEQLARIDVPTLVMVGTDDKSTPVDPNVTRAFEYTTSNPLYRVELVAAEHQSFTDVCDFLDFLPMLENPTEAVVDVLEDFAVAGCSEGDMPTDRVQELTNTFAVSFLDSIFGDGEMITPDTTAIPDDVIYLVK